VTRALTITGYLAVLVAATALDIAARRPASSLPSIGDLASKLSARRIGRVLVIGWWWWLGWHFFVR